MKRCTKSQKSFNSSKKYYSEKEAFYGMYEELKAIDRLCCELNKFDDQDGIDRYEALQREIIIDMMALNVELKIKDKVVDTYLQHLVFVLGL